MKRRTRINYTPEQKAIIWDRYKQGDSLHDIDRMFDRFHSAIMPTIHQAGGYRPPVRKRHRLALSLDEREEISRGLVARRSIRGIAAKLSRAPSTISRKIRRHGGAKQYRAAKADIAAWENALRPEPCKLIESPTLCKIIAEKMHQDCSGTSVRGRPLMSKIGPPQLRAKLYMSALCGKIYNKRMRNIYDEMCLRGKPKMVAIGALMRKLVHWCYGVLKTGTVFNDEGLKQVLST